MAMGAAGPGIEGSLWSCREGKETFDVGIEQGARDAAGMQCTKEPCRSGGWLAGLDDGRMNENHRLSRYLGPPSWRIWRCIQLLFLRMYPDGFLTE